ncbi:hypothetical protein GALMADRAFT_236785 [Galerina marginata CBS 339.88]|uniref:F-box domain-containing protein n=1 Tax=Galerina marginata (strain CBS 339.88) TaxID=685588 RepID=A0A067TLT1_GALM3|nr:hypothetical protein GALMADRAFT_236785 [Galerina marginata CBS 339.88]
MIPHSPGHVESEEFTTLTNLSSEFHVIDRSSFPFRSLQEQDIQILYGHPRRYDEDYYFVRGNYVAGSIIHGLRKQAKANTNCFPELQIVFDLPTELVQEIFERLHPIDLYNMIRSSKGLRSLLLSRRSYAVWSGAFARHPDVPACPLEMSFPQWASFLFGPNKCDDCGSPEAMPDFGLRKRLCQFCLDADLQYSEDSEILRDKLGNQSAVLWTLVSQNHRYVSMTYPTRSNMSYEGRYSTREVEERTRQMQGFLSAIEDKKPNAKQAYEGFKTQTAALVSETLKHAKTCNKWASDIYDEIEETFTKTLVPLWLEKWKKYLVASGHDPRDVAAIETDMLPLLYTYPLSKCSKKGLRSYTSRIRDSLSMAKAHRITQKRQKLIDARKMEVGTLYSAYQRTLDPMSWQQLPSLRNICLMTASSDYIYSVDPSQTIPAENISESIRQYVERWFEYGRRQLSATMADHHKHQLNTIADSNALDLAMATFICPLHDPGMEHPGTSTVLIGWDNVALHFDCTVPHDPGRLFGNVEHGSPVTYSVLAYNTVKHLLELLGLNPDTTLASDLSTLKARFMCRSCLWERRARRPSMTLEECATHVVKHSDHTPQSFGLLSEEFTESILFHENSFTQAAELFWCCRNCSEHFQASTTRKAVISHVKEAHSIAVPVARTDFFYGRHTDQPERKKYFVNWNPSQSYRCHRCQDGKKARLWTLKPLLDHLGNAHGILDPIQNKDWIQLRIWKDSSQEDDSDLSYDWMAFPDDPDLQMFS